MKELKQSAVKQPDANQSGSYLYSPPVIKGTLNYGVTSLAFSPIDGKLVSGGFENIIRIWDTNTENNAPVFYKALEGHVGWVLSLAFSPVNGMLASEALME